MEVNDKKELTEEERENAYVLWFNQLRRADVALVGGKSSSLGELTSGTDVPVPYGFATTACGLPALLGSQWLEREGKCLAGNFEGPGRLRRTAPGLQPDQKDHARGTNAGRLRRRHRQLI